tara:strand:+ start:481 stop:1935 length:1455 start_codon:yes stop_codon:yes gene_type:complete
VALILKPKRGTSTPTTSDIVSGEIAIDTSAQLLYINDNGSIKTIGDGTGSSGTVSEAFKTITISGQSDVVADGATDTLTLVAGTGITLTTNASTDTITITSTATGSALTIQDEGSALSTAGSTLNFVGAGVVASGTGATKTITINGYSDSDVDTHLNTSTASTNEVLSWNGSDYDWVAQSGGSSSTVYQYADAGMVEYEYTASANQTTFSGTDSNSATLSYTANSIMVFLNGVLQDDGVDYTATNGTSVVFGTALAANDEVRIIAVSSTATLHNPTKLDAITTVNSQAAYSLTLNTAAYTPSHVNALIVSVNGITQEPGDSFTISGSTITFAPALSTGDVVDYIIDMGRKFHVPEWEGDFTIDSPTLHVDSTNNRVGIGTLTPSYLLDVNGQANVTTLSLGGTAITSTAAELNYVDGVTSNIQTQLDAKLGDITSESLGDLSDVTVTSPSNGQVLKYNGSAWVNSSDSVGATVDDATALAIALG